MAIPLSRALCTGRTQNIHRKQNNLAAYTETRQNTRKEKTAMRFALVGNQNSGKTTLFNALCGSTQHVGNFPGVTVEKKEGMILGTHHTVFDLPGIYSLTPYTPEEEITGQLLCAGKPDAILNVVDGSNLTRNLYLTLQLLPLGIPMIVLITKYDLMERNGGSFSKKALSEALGVPVAILSAERGTGIENLSSLWRKARIPFRFPRGVPPPPPSYASLLLHTMPGADAVMRAEKHYVGFPLAGTQATRTFLRAIPPTREDDAEKLILWRYRVAEELAAKAFPSDKERKTGSRTERADRFLLSGKTAFPFLCLVLLSFFLMIFGRVGQALCKIPLTAADRIMRMLHAFLESRGVSAPLCDFLTEGIFAGIASVLSFLPLILLFFFLLSLLEDSGYMARISCLLDAPMRKLGLSGRVAVPLLLGFGCSVPAAMATRTLRSENERKKTMHLLPFFSCSAKLPVYLLFSAAFFAGKTAFLLTGLYLLGILLAFFSAWLMKKEKGAEESQFTELPPYHFPTLRNTLTLMREKTRDFFKRTFTIIFLSGMAVWLLSSLTPSFTYTDRPEEAVLSLFSVRLLPLFAPLGIQDWRCIAALFAGIGAKENILSTLAVLTGTGGDGLVTVLPALFTAPAALSYLVFVLLYTPCLSALAAMKEKGGSRLTVPAICLFQCVLAYLLAAMTHGIFSALL